MPCVHLKQLYKLCQENEIKIGGLDVVRLVCKQCDVKDVCPSVLTDEFDAQLDGARQQTQSTDAQKAKQYVND